MTLEKLSNENKTKIRKLKFLENLSELFILITKRLGYRFFLMAKILAWERGYRNSLPLIHVFINSKRHTFLTFWHLWNRDVHSKSMTYHSSINWQHFFLQCYIQQRILRVTATEIQWNTVFLKYKLHPIIPLLKILQWFLIELGIESLMGHPKPHVWPGPTSPTSPILCHPSSLWLFSIHMSFPSVLRTDQLHRSL